MGKTCETHAKNNGNHIAGLTVGWKEGFTELTSSSVIQHAETPTWHIEMKGDGEDKGDANLNPNHIHIFTPFTSIWCAFLS